MHFLLLRLVGRLGERRDIRTCRGFGGIENGSVGVGWIWLIQWVVLYRAQCAAT